ncbi:MAG: isoprenylcysteine carboxylmethyltransferase family protein [Deltaproteobacteria bacterium]|nr:MAG: isoprenylcysteine carboxylmethyltransferase family protein [Deltaproteobacteria bacterium]
MFKHAYWFFSYLGVMSFSAAFAMGFRHDPQAPFANLVFNVILYTVFIAVHILMTTPAFKKAVFGRPEGTTFERRIFVTVSVVTWVSVYWLHKPTGGFAFVAPAWLQFIGTCGLLLSVVAFFEFATFESLGRLLGLPGNELSHSAGAETPLMTEGPYASVRHPMYRAACFIVLCSLLIHPHAGQLLFAVLSAASFLGFVPFEEAQLVRARGEEYREYMRRTPFRAFRGVW